MHTVSTIKRPTRWTRRSFSRVCRRHAFPGPASREHPSQWLHSSRSVDPMFPRRHRNNNIARLRPAGWIRSVVRTDGEPLGFRVACLNAQMIGGIAVASRRLASLPPVRRFVALTMARWILRILQRKQRVSERETERVYFPLAVTCWHAATCYAHLINPLVAMLMPFFSRKGWLFRDTAWLCPPECCYLGVRSSYDL